MQNYLKYTYNYFEIPSTYEAKGSFLDFLKNFLVNLQYSPHICKSMGVPFILDEALTNALEHGNKFDQNKKIKIYIQAESQKLIFYIEDEGDGFQYKNLPDPTDPLNMFNESGRGLFFIRNYADNVRFNKKGNGIYITVTDKNE